MPCAASMLCHWKCLEGALSRPDTEQGKLGHERITLGSVGTSRSVGAHSGRAARAALVQQVDWMGEQRC